MKALENYLANKVRIEKNQNLLPQNLSPDQIALPGA